MSAGCIPRGPSSGAAVVMALDGHAPDIAGDCFVADTATVIGQVTLGSEASVWFNVVIRGDLEPVTIGARTNIQDGAILHTDPGRPLRLGAAVTVGHGAILHGCSIGDGTLVGIGAVVLSGAEVGKGCIVGAGALVTEGKVIPDHSVVFGSPAKIVRTLTSTQSAELLSSADHYVRNAARYRQALGAAIASRIEEVS